jgi:hypothetical protein
MIEKKLKSEHSVTDTFDGGLSESSLLIRVIHTVPNWYISTFFWINSRACARVSVFIIFIFLCCNNTSLFSNLDSSEEAGGALDSAGPDKASSLTTLDAHRATLVARLRALRLERAELLLENFSLGKKDGKHKDTISKDSRYR